ncbi:hypothetical protein [Anaerosporobacter sp.]|uniref:hypothetical protein n=1 Tax=Anaerosporobacter sp. TaxID=1872529 RepID=UPI00286EB544|nr:hypothetical protein [Anaerosporobacter sp.]
MDKIRIVLNNNELIPRYSSPDARSRNKDSIVRYEDGSLKSIYLESISTINTSIGTLTAEFITFYPNQNIHRVFPVYGQISGFWSEEEEKELLAESVVKVGNRLYTGLFSCICFYETGEVKSLTIWQGESMEVDTNYGKMKVRYGISFYKDGSIQSLEPENPVIITQDTGIYIAYNPLAVGVTGDSNSLRFDREGRVSRLTTIATGIRCIPRNGEPEFILKAKLMTSPFDITEEILIPVQIAFEEDGIVFTDSRKVEKRYSYKEYTLEAYEESEYLSTMCSGDCSACKGCH